MDHNDLIDMPVSELSDEQLLTIVNSTRNERTKPVTKTKRKEKKIDLDALLSGLSSEEIANLLSSLEIDGNGEES